MPAIGVECRLMRRMQSFFNTFINLWFEEKKRERLIISS